MSVYVDDTTAHYRGMTMCHVVADSHAELIAMADSIGLSSHWIQSAGTPEEHFDVSASKRALAVKHGAIEITVRQMARFCLDRRDR